MSIQPITNHQSPITNHQSTITATWRGQASLLPVPVCAPSESDACFEKSLAFKSESDAYFEKCFTAVFKEFEVASIPLLATLGPSQTFKTKPPKSPTGAQSQKPVTAAKRVPRNGRGTTCVQEHVAPGPSARRGMKAAKMWCASSHFLPLALCAALPQHSSVTSSYQPIAPVADAQPDEGEYVRTEHFAFVVGQKRKQEKMEIVRSPVDAGLRRSPQRRRP